MTAVEEMSRRDFGEVFLGSALSIGSMLGSSGASASEGAERLAGMTTRDLVRAFMKSQASLKEEKVIWRTRGVIMAYVPGRTPEPLLRFKGCEQQWVRPITDTKFVRYNSLINFMCDYETDEIIDAFKNPFTGKTNKVSHYVSRVPEGMEISEDGVFLNIVRQAYPEFYKDSKFEMDIAVIEDDIAFRGEVKWPAELRQPPSGSMQSFFSRYSEVMDPKTASAPCHFAGHVLMNWYPWMEMPEQLGHMLWHATGYKVRSWDSLPRDYLARATRDYAEIFDKSPQLDVGPSPMARRLKAAGGRP